jgi:hypothetical protein
LSALLQSQNSMASPLLFQKIKTTLDIQNPQTWTFLFCPSWLNQFGAPHRGSFRQPKLN